MAQGSTIEWTDATWNPIAGCTPVSPGCLHCYAAKMAHRLSGMGQQKYRGLTVLHNGIRTFNGTINLRESELTIPMKWKRPRRVFVNSMSDLFHEGVPFGFVDKVFAVMALTPQHTYQILTKRPERMAEYVALPFGVDRMLAILSSIGAPWNGLAMAANNWITDNHWLLNNVWLGTSPCNQKTADELIPHLRRCPAAVRFLSVEPMIGPAVLDLNGIDWVIVGGESGGSKKHPARPFNVEWVRSIVSQCKAAGVPVFVKQLGVHVIDSNTTSAAHFEPEECWREGTKTKGHRVRLKSNKGGNMNEWPEDLRVREFPAAVGAVGQ